MSERPCCACNVCAPAKHCVKLNGSNPAYFRLHLTEKPALVLHQKCTAMDFSYTSCGRFSEYHWPEIATVNSYLALILNRIQPTLRRHLMAKSGNTSCAQNQ